jgi:hypothetical protein
VKSLISFTGLALLATISATSVAAPATAGPAFTLEPLVPLSALKAVEVTTNNTFAPDANDPWALLGDARGTYLPGYGAIFTFEMSLVNVTPITPFHLTITPQEVKSIHDRKIKKLVVLKAAMHDLMLKAAASLTSLPPTEQITFEAYLISFSFEDRTGLPRRLTMTVSRQKLLDAAAHHATPDELAALIEEQEQ